jgi:hypothetical protein
MVPPTGDGGSPAPIDRPILEFLQTRLQATGQVSHAAITDTSGHLELQVIFVPSYYPPPIDDATLTVRWYTNDDFTIGQTPRWVGQRSACPEVGDVERERRVQRPLQLGV